MRKSGVLMPVSALPASFGVGDFGPAAYDFIDLIEKMQIKIWQVLPLNPLGYGNSPYQAYSSFAGDELYISLEKLCDNGLLIDAELASNPFSASNRVDYLAARNFKMKLLFKAFERFKQSSKWLAEYQEFISQNSWVKNYAVFLTLKKVNNLQIWTNWPAAHKNWIKNQKLDLSCYQVQIDYEMFLQFIFYRQWHLLKAYANAKGIAIMGDIPIYIGLDSLDVWENQELFLLDDKQEPTFIAGVPPDFFSETGQRWGNPLYDWSALEASDFKFWIERLAGNAAAFDIIRIDHFRAFDTYWKIPSSCPTAIDGEWVEAPGYALFDKIYQELPDIQIVAEDLGDLRDEVLVLRDHYKLKGMKIFQFMFKANADNSELENTLNTIIYTGTHDNSTLMGWYQGLTESEQAALNVYFSAGPDTIKAAMLRYVLNSSAEIAIFPVQDLIGLDESARFNTPGKIGSPNWEWRLNDFSRLEQEIDFIRGEVIAAGRAIL